MSEFVPLGENASVAVRVDDAPELPLFMTIPTPVAKRNRIGLGERVTASLLAEAIHLMPREENVSAGAVEFPSGSGTRAQNSKTRSSPATSA